MNIRDLLLREEGLVLRPYNCPAGFLTIGVGRNLEHRGISRDEAFMLLDNDIAACTEDAESFGWFSAMSDNRKTVVVAMIFQIGLDGFHRFKNMIEALESFDYPLAAKEMLDSKWAKSDSPDRARRMAEMMLEG